MPTLELDRLRAWVQADGAALDPFLPSEVANADTDPVPFAEPGEKIGAAVIEAGDDEAVDWCDSTRQYTICDMREIERAASGDVPREHQHKGFRRSGTKCRKREHLQSSRYFR